MFPFSFILIGALIGNENKSLKFFQKSASNETRKQLNALRQKNKYLILLDIITMFA